MFEFEEKCLKEGKKYIAGVDEAGRGPLCGPVVISAVIMPLSSQDRIEGVNDSKKLSPKKREELYKKIIEKAICYSIIYKWQNEIDELNIYKATQKGMEEAISTLENPPDYALVDAMKGLNLPCQYLPIIKGDQKSYSIACASILAKVSRDHTMLELDSKYPQYDLKTHKGYCTAKHLQLLKQYGANEIYRKSFLKNFEGQIKWIK